MKAEGWIDYNYINLEVTKYIDIFITEFIQRISILTIEINFFGELKS